MIAMVFRTTTPREWFGDLTALAAAIFAGAAIYHAAAIIGAIIGGVR